MITMRVLLVLASGFMGADGQPGRAVHFQNHFVGAPYTFDPADKPRIMDEYEPRAPRDYPEPLRSAFEDCRDHGIVATTEAARRNAGVHWMTWTCTLIEVPTGADE